MQQIVKQPLPENRKAGMTLHELAMFVQSCHANDIDPDRIIGARVGFRGQLQLIETTDKRRVQP